jgi:signal transduction histidine kinase
MTVFSSLRSRIFLTTALLAVLSIAVAIYLVNRRVTRETEAALQRDILSTGALVDQLRATRAQTFMTMARFIADTSQLKAAVDTNDPQTVQDVVRELPQQLNSSLLVVTNRRGAVLATVGTAPGGDVIMAIEPAVRDALAGHERVGLLPHPNGVLQLVTVPIALYKTDPDILGTLSVGFLLDPALAAQLKSITGSDIAFAVDGQVLATTLRTEDRTALSALLHRPGLSRSVRVGGQDYVALPRPLAPNADGLPAGSGPVVLILRSRSQQSLLLRTIREYLALTAVLAVLVATLLSFAVARTITRPLAAITDVMREVAATGDLTRKIALRHAGRWDDEDARLLATTFNTLTDSIARFQREISQKERLSALGRLSTVIAHEVRNPLMIIKAALHALRQPDVGASAVREAIADIDEEVVRLNRVVNEVLDFARPIRFELAPTDVNVLCRESAAAAQAAGPGPTVHLDLDATLPRVTADPERLRIALVNLLVNARHAVEARAPEEVAAAHGGGPSGSQPAGRTGQAVSDPAAAGRTVAAPAVVLTTRASAERATIVIADQGAGIDLADLPRVFDPYFTTKRGGTGLGLAIAKNIIDGLGGAIGVTSAPGRGTEIRIDLPLTLGADLRTGPAPTGPSDPSRPDGHIGPHRQA